MTPIHHQPETRSRTARGVPRYALGGYLWRRTYPYNARVTLHDCNSCATSSSGWGDVLSPRPKECARMVRVEDRSQRVNCGWTATTTDNRQGTTSVRTPPLRPFVFPPQYVPLFHAEFEVRPWRSRAAQTTLFLCVFADALAGWFTISAWPNSK